ncbi:hypothetical protein R6Q57_006601 [Mikania cordata]
MIPDSIVSLIWPATLCSAGLLEPGRRHAGAGHRLSASHRPPQYCMSAPWHQGRQPTAAILPETAADHQAATWLCSQILDS